MAWKNIKLINNNPLTVGSYLLVKHFHIRLHMVFRYCFSLHLLKVQKRRAVHNHMRRSGCMFMQAYVDLRPVAVATGFATCHCCLQAPGVMNCVLETVCAQQMLDWFVLQIFDPLFPSPPSVIHSLIFSSLLSHHYVKVSLPLFVSAALHQLHSSLRWYVIILLVHYCLDEGWRKE